MNFIAHSQIRRSVKIWLFIGVILVFFQVIIGGITRLTGSGLSITKWEIVTGTLPPVNTIEWEEAFGLYKETPQYQKINKGMSMPEFKFIYFWEYFHRLWARSMGLIFLFPFLFFLFRGELSKRLLKQLAVVILFAVIVASFGWIMVASGLIDRPLVNAYKLTFHLSLALILYAYLFWTFLDSLGLKPIKISENCGFKLKFWIKLALIVLGVQIFIGGIMSGMKAGLFYPTFPDMNGQLIPSVLFNADSWTMQNIIDYDKHNFMAALVQFVHRYVAYILSAIILYASLKSKRYPSYKVINKENNLLIIMLITQVSLGVITVVNCIGNIPILWGSLHQAGAIILLSSLLLVHYRITNNVLNKP